MVKAIAITPLKTIEIADWDKSDFCRLPLVDYPLQAPVDWFGPPYKLTMYMLDEMDPNRGMNKMGTFIFNRLCGPAYSATDPAPKKLNN